MCFYAHLALHTMGQSVGAANLSSDLLMPLPPALHDTMLTHECPHCAKQLEKPGGYFLRIRQYHCRSCQQPVLLTYEDKLKLFDKHTRREARTAKVNGGRGER